MSNVHEHLDLIEEEIRSAEEHVSDPTAIVPDVMWTPLIITALTMTMILVLGNFYYYTVIICVDFLWLIALR